MFEKEKELYARLDNVMDRETITFSCEEAEHVEYRPEPEGRE
jgi:hypothetical protein